MRTTFGLTRLGRMSALAGLGDVKLSETVGSAAAGQVRPTQAEPPDWQQAERSRRGVQEGSNEKVAALRPPVESVGIDAVGRDGRFGLRLADEAVFGSFLILARTGCATSSSWRSTTRPTRRARRSATARPAEAPAGRARCRLGVGLFGASGDGNLELVPFGGPSSPRAGLLTECVLSRRRWRPGLRQGRECVQGGRRATKKAGSAEINATLHETR